MLAAGCQFVPWLLVASMHIITRKRLNDFAHEHPDCSASLVQWFRHMRSERFSNIGEVRSVFPHADKVVKFTVFNIGGNKARLIAAIHYNRGKVYIRHILTHNEYDKGAWKK
jgi:mRNA interferase HigB